MTSPTTTDLGQSLTELGLRALGAGLDDFLQRAKKARLSPAQLLEELVVIERDDRARRSLERRQARSRIGNFKPMTDFDWDWPTELDRDLVEAALKLRFIDEGANLVIVGAHGLGKTMILKNIAHQAILAGHAVLCTTAAKMLGELSGIDSPSKLERRLKHYSRVRFLCVDEVGYLSYDNRAADLLFEIVTRRYEAGKSMALTTNLAFKDWATVFPHATCTVALVDRLTHRADILKIEGDSWRRKEALERQNREADQ
jgi:DNA replication protein DnaC